MARGSERAASIVAWIGFAAGLAATASALLLPSFSRLDGGGVDPDFALPAWCVLAGLASWGLWFAVAAEPYRRRSRQTMGVAVLLTAFGLLVFLLLAGAVASATN